MNINTVMRGVAVGSLAFAYHATNHDELRAYTCYNCEAPDGWPSNYEVCVYRPDPPGWNGCAYSYGEWCSASPWYCAS